MEEDLHDEAKIQMGLKKDVMSTGIHVCYFWTGPWVLPRLGVGWAVRESHECSWGAGVGGMGNRDAAIGFCFDFMG